MSEQELKTLKEQIKKEVIAEMQAKKENQNTWQRIKNEYKEEFEKFNFIDHLEFVNSENQLITRDEEIGATYPLQNAIGTLLRIVNKSKTVTKMDISYEEAKDIVEKILNILKEKVEVRNELEEVQEKLQQEYEKEERKTKQVIE